ncbi:hypothetical protein [Modestobacter sp. Leaf380]|uniref:hypothetical protein n=1 Tax=Modestobacter sp. Leaf380 TaxID=1736356 RepID=UPI0006F3FB6B|nr:hypothetical protein [Modestobacter sp. Leaf380]KQS66169.1 hypothetical protein ASG41_12550 [Modestobacter sp. Leaf380]
MVRSGGIDHGPFRLEALARQSFALAAAEVNARRNDESVSPRNQKTFDALHWLGHLLDQWHPEDLDMDELAMLLGDAVEEDFQRYEFEGSAPGFAAQRLRDLAAALTAEADERDRANQ